MVSVEDSWLLDGDKVKESQYNKSKFTFTSSSPKVKERHC